MIDHDYPFVDEHEFNCTYVKTRFNLNQVMKEKPRMTCFEKLRSEHPDWDENTLYEYTLRNCPSYLKLLPDPSDCTYGTTDYHCTACWNREMEG